MRMVTNLKRNRMTTDERKLLESYRILDDHEKHEVLELATFILFKRTRDISPKQEETNNIIHFKKNH